MPERKTSRRVAPPSTRASKPKPVSARRAPRTEAPARASSPSRKHGAQALIAVDIGNSDTVIGLFQGAELAGFWRLVSRSITADEAGLQLDGLLRRLGSAAPTTARSVLCSGVPSLTLVWAEALARRTGERPVEVNAQSAGIPIRYHDKTAVGPDRLANAVAVRRLYGTPAIVVDLGTATTFDCVSREGAYLGGVIAPGIATSAEGLISRAARLPRVELRAPARALGRTTEEALQSGIIWGSAGMIDALVRRIALEMKGTPHVIATGGFAPSMAEHCETINRVDEALTLKGMRLIREGKS